MLQKMVTVVVGGGGDGGVGSCPFVVFLLPSLLLSSVNLFSHELIAQSLARGHRTGPIISGVKNTPEKRYQV